MADELKSAYERALEKLKEQGVESDPAPVTEEQKAEMDKIRALYRSKIAELEIALQSDSRKAVMAQNAEELLKIRENFVSQRGRMEREMERKLSEIRKAANTQQPD